MSSNSKKFVSFRYYLQEVLLQRCQKNPNYSLRAYARDLEIHPTTLSQILSGRRNMTLEAYKKISTHLKITKAQAQWFENKILAQQNKKTKTPRKDIINIKATDGSELAPWYHQAIVEATKLKDFKPTARWLAERLSISEKEASEAVQRLLRFGILFVDDNGQWVPADLNTVIVPEVPVDAIKEEVKGSLLRAHRAMDAVPFGKKFTGAVLFSMTTEHLKKFFQQLDEAQIGVIESTDEGGPYDEVYCLTTAIFPVT